VDLSDQSFDAVPDFELLRRDSGGQRLADRGDQFLSVSVELNDSHGDGFADVEDVREVGDEVLATFVSTKLSISRERNAPRLGLRHKRPKSAKQVDNTPFLQNL
jgi:hypothetical protein